MKLCIFCNITFSSVDWHCPNCARMPTKQDNYYSFISELTIDRHGFPSEAFSELAKMEAKHFWFRARNQLIIWALKKYFPISQNFLEIGCGTGYVLSGIAKEFPELNLSGSDLYREGILFASQRLNNENLFQMDARAIPFVEEFDVIGAFDVLEHIEEDEKVLAEIYKALKKKGGLILTVPQHAFLWSPADDYACHVRRYSQKELKNKLEKSGFQILRMTSFMSLLFPFMLISRYQMKKNEKFDPIREVKINRTINYLFEKILFIEFKLTQLGLRFPFGGSLLVVAEKL